MEVWTEIHEGVDYLHFRQSSNIGFTGFVRFQQTSKTNETNETEETEGENSETSKRPVIVNFIN